MLGFYAKQNLSTKRYKNHNFFIYFHSDGDGGRLYPQRIYGVVLQLHDVWLKSKHETKAFLKERINTASGYHFILILTL